MNPDKSEVKALSARILSIPGEIEECTREFNDLMGKFKACNIPPYPNSTTEESVFDLFSDTMKGVYDGFSALEHLMNVTKKEFDEMLEKVDTTAYKQANSVMLNNLLNGLFDDNED